MGGMPPGAMELFIPCSITSGGVHTGRLGPYVLSHYTCYYTLVVCVYVLLCYVCCHIFYLYTYSSTPIYKLMHEAYRREINYYMFN